MRAAIRKCIFPQEKTSCFSYVAAGRPEPVAQHKVPPIICVHLSKFSFRKRSDVPFSPAAFPLASSRQFQELPRKQKKKKDAKKRSAYLSSYSLFPCSENMDSIEVPAKRFSRVDPGSNDRKLNNKAPRKRDKTRHV
ncbi:hypothetical protein J3459_012540 [Metarhizium acridum]|nr:hypothetical protein J3459_012540 [Metarhizium acridum]